MDTPYEEHLQKEKLAAEKKMAEMECLRESLSFDAEPHHVDLPKVRKKDHAKKKKSRRAMVKTSRKTNR